MSCPFPVLFQYSVLDKWVSLEIVAANFSLVDYCCVDKIKDVIMVILMVFHYASFSGSVEMWESP